MTTRRRWLLCAAALVGLAAVGLVVVAMLPTGPGVTKANFDLVSEGMTKDQVGVIFGSEPFRVKQWSFPRLNEADSVYGWASKNGLAFIGFDGDERVVLKEWRGARVLERLYGWLFPAT